MYLSAETRDLTTLGQKQRRKNTFPTWNVAAFEVHDVRRRINPLCTPAPDRAPIAS